MGDTKGEAAYEAVKILVSLLREDTRKAFMEKASRHSDPDVRWLSHKETYGELLKR